MVGHHQSKLDLLADTGCRAVLESEFGPVKPADVVVEATGSAAGLERAMQLVRPRGTVVLKTTVADPNALDLTPVVIHELRIVGSRCGDMGRAVKALAAQKVDPGVLVHRRCALAQGEEALSAAGSRGTLKVLIDVQGGRDG
jgi:threonine dehydrogenase-like Zn-dependent dehydrogenase